jgi:hypothetical protein
MSENPILMIQAEYARSRNKSPQYIGKLYKAGILVMRGRLVDVAASDAVLEDKPSERTIMDGQAPTGHAQARPADTVFRAKCRLERTFVSGVMGKKGTFGGVHFGRCDWLQDMSFLRRKTRRGGSTREERIHRREGAEAPRPGRVLGLKGGVV